MTTQVTLFQNTAAVPAHIAARMGQLSPLMQSVVANLTGDSTPRLKLEQGRWRIREGGDEIMLDTLHADVIVIGALPNESKTFYAKAYIPGQDPAAPDCASVRGDKPDAGSTAPQAASCATCPQNVWGSKITPQGTETKACADTRRLAVVAKDDPEGTVYQVAVPAASLKNFKAYMKQLAARGWSIDTVVTRLTAGVANFPLYEFNAIAFVDEATMGAVSSKMGSEEVDSVLGLVGRMAIAAPAPQAAIAAPVVAAPAAPAAPVVAAPPPMPAMSAGMASFVQTAMAAVNTSMAAPVTQSAIQTVNSGVVGAIPTTAIVTQPVILPNIIRLQINFTP